MTQQTLTLEMVSNLQRYEELKSKVKECEDEIKKLQPIIMSIVPEDKELLTDKGFFYLQKRSTWKFSEAVEAEEEKLEQMKLDEKGKGIAKAEIKNTLYYKTGRPEVRETVE